MLSCINFYNIDLETKKIYLCCKNLVDHEFNLMIFSPSNEYEKIFLKSSNSYINLK